MKILDTMKKFPAGMQVIPLLLACTINTFAPQLLQIGGFTSGIFSNAGAPTAVGMFMFCTGTTINLKKAGEPLAKGAVMLVAQYAMGVGIGLAIGWIFGPLGILGIAPVAAIAAISSHNAVMYIVLAQKVGVTSDVGAIAPMSLADGPFLTMVALGATGMANIPVKSLIAALFPLFLGMILANIDPKFRELASSATPFLIPFNGWTLGAGMTWAAVLKAGIPGIILGLVTLIVTGYGTYYIYNIIFRRKRRPLATGFATGNTAGNAIATPQMVAHADPSMAAIAPIATAQVATSCVVTAILCPLMTMYLDKKLTKKYGPLTENELEPATN